MEKMRFSIIICTYNRLTYLENCLQSLSNQNYPRNLYEIIVVNDGSTDNTKQYCEGLAARQPLFLIYLEEANRGPAAARNAGASIARGEILAFLDDDCEAPRNWLTNTDSVFQDHADIAGLGSHTLLSFGEGVLDKRKYWGGKNTESYMPLEFAPQKWLSTHNFAIRKMAFDKVDGFDGKLRYPDEDLDLMYRLLEAGYKLLRTAKTAVYHHARPTLKKLFKQMYIFGQCDTRIFRRHFPGWFVLDFYVGRFINLKEFFYIKKSPINFYIRLDFFKFFALSFFLMPLAAFIPLLYIFLVWLAILIKEKRLFLSLRLTAVLLTRDFAYMLGHISGSITQRIIYF